MNSIVYNEGDDTPQFDLPLENELLKLKLKAEFGADCWTGRETVPDEVLHEFLSAVYRFEQQYRKPVLVIPVYEKIGRPSYRDEIELNDAQISMELNRILIILHEHRLAVDVLGTYPERQIYKFVTEELFHMPVECINLPGFIYRFCYEDFHPNDELDIRQRVIEFLSHWFNRQLDEYCCELAEVFIHPDTRQFSQKAVLQKVSNIFKAYRSYKNCEYRINRLEWSTDEHESGNAVVCGDVRFEAILESEEASHQSGPFELYLSKASGWWSIFYFIFPGFSWNK